MRIAAQRWELEIRPERGGRIVSLRLDGEELLDQGIGVDQPSANGFVEGGAFGWDEMVPNVDATDTLPDHGEAWRLPWEVVDSSRMQCRGRLVPWELQRQLEIDDMVSVAYRYRNAGTGPHLAYWCAHPLFKFESAMQIGFSGGHRLAGLAPGTSAKVFLPKGSVDRVGLRWKSGTGIEMSWDPTLTPYVGIWACNGDLGGYRQIAIEPATGGNDKPDPAAPPPLLKPGETYEWWLRIRAL
jgi:galactose mutarotase-like enzyme